MVREHLFEAIQLQPSFWVQSTAPFPKTEDIRLSDYLYTVLKNGALEAKNYVLTSSALLQVQSRSEKEVTFLQGDIRWCTVEPQFRQTRIGIQYGFSIHYKDEEMTFFAASDYACGEWLRQLEFISVLRNIENTFTVGCLFENSKFCKLKEAISLETGEKVTLKEIPKAGLERSPRRLRALLNEILVLRAVSHPNIARLYHVYEDKDRITLVYENLRGALLSESIKQKKFSEAEAKGLMVGLLDLIVYLEEKSILHRDFKPKNFLLTDTSDRTKFKAIDFSIARMYSESPISDSLGSPGYIAPEVLAKRQYGPAVDVYSAGIVFYMLIAVRNPFETPARSTTIARNLKSEIAFGPEFEGVDEKIKTMIRLMTHFNPSERMSAARLKSLLLEKTKLRARPPMLPRITPLRGQQNCNDQGNAEEWGHKSFSHLPRASFNTRLARDSFS